MVRMMKFDLCNIWWPIWRHIAKWVAQGGSREFALQNLKYKMDLAEHSLSYYAHKGVSMTQYQLCECLSGQEG